MRENGLCGPIVAFSGALLLDEERNVLFGSGMDRDTAAQVVRFAEGWDSTFPGAPIPQETGW